MLLWELKSHEAQVTLSGHFRVESASLAVRRKALRKEATHLFDGW